MASNEEVIERHQSVILLERDRARRARFIPREPPGDGEDEHPGTEQHYLQRGKAVRRIA